MSSPKSAKTIPFSWRTCHCTDFWIGDGIIRTLLIAHRPELKWLSKEPCTHWEKGRIKL